MMRLFIAGAVLATMVIKTHAETPTDRFFHKENRSVEQQIIDSAHDTPGIFKALRIEPWHRIKIIEDDENYLSTTLRDFQQQGVQAPTKALSKSQYDTVISFYGESEYDGDLTAFMLQAYQALKPGGHIGLVGFTPSGPNDTGSYPAKIVMLAAEKTGFTAINKVLTKKITTREQTLNGNTITSMRYVIRARKPKANRTHEHHGW